MRRALLALAAAALCAPLLAAPDPSQWKGVALVKPEELVETLKKPGEKPVLLHVGFRVLYDQSHIPGSIYAGPGREAAGIEALRKAVASVPKTKTIVLYCGCCPWQHCPNLEAPWRTLREMGFTNVKVLMIPQNFGADWARKGYPAEAS